ncbi:cytochrome c5 [Massilia aurea]|uniref:Cytochrome c5 n=1 Tax=Massilia aurea TaxID=373040 RepID=A0A7X0CEX9_9BURK|nr:c-type cytochrome [Massilia aurea]MBB6134309.1 cytochrome c5 [Massilia aurea]
MSDAQHDHESLIRTPKQLVVAVAGFFLVVVLGIILLVTFVTSASTEGAGSDATSAKAIAARIRPVADAGFTLRDANTPRVLLAGGAVYIATCAACHDSGMAGSPKTGDTAAWATRLAQGYDTLVTHAINGIRAMPAKGGNPDLDDLEVARAVVFMTNKSGASFKEPVAPAPAAAATPVAGDAATATAGAPVAAVPAATAAAVPAPAGPAAAAATAAAPVAGPAVASADTGKKAYETACIACHGAGIAGAPKFGDKAAWSTRIGQGASVLYDHAIKGFQGKAGYMPPKGGSTLPDADVKAAVDYMAAAVK